MPTQKLITRRLHGRKILLFLEPNKTGTIVNHFFLVIICAYTSTCHQSHSQCDIMNTEPTQTKMEVVLPTEIVLHRVIALPLTINNSCFRVLSATNVPSMCRRKERKIYLSGLPRSPTTCSSKCFYRLRGQLFSCTTFARS